MPQFDPPSNYKDPEKIQQWLDAKKIGWAGEAALSPVTGRVDAIGFILPNQPPAIHLNQGRPDDEKSLLRDFWQLFRVMGESHYFVGFNIKRFDLSFLVRRSWKLGVALPLGIRPGRYWSDQFMDLMELWQLGDGKEYIGLDKLAKFLGLGAKNGSGADFHKLPPKDKKKYLANDLSLTKALAERMLVC